MKRSALALSLLATLTLIPAQAANTLFTTGDLLIHFQQFGGTNTVYANLGLATEFRGAATGAQDAPTMIDIIDLGDTLTTAFGAGWASDPNIYVGLAAVRNPSGTSSSVVGGDASQTVYLGQGRGAVDASSLNTTGYTISNSTSMNNVANGVSSLQAVFANGDSLLASVVPTSTSAIDNQHPFGGTPALPTQGSAYATIGGGVQQKGAAGSLGTVAGVGTVEFALDLHRIVGRSNSPVAGPLRGSTFEGTVLVGSDGMVSFGNLSTIPEPSGVLALGLIGTLAGLGYRRRNA